MKWSAPLVLVLPALVSATVPGIDVSHFQGTINWKTVRANGVRWAYIKATEGTSSYNVSVSDGKYRESSSKLRSVQGPYVQRQL